MSLRNNCGKLSTFQKTMLHWRELHPYNASHTVRISEPLDRARLDDAIRSTLTRYGLTGLVLDKRRRRYRYEGGPSSAAVTLIEGAGNPLRALSAEIENQINAPFTDEAEACPFRFFAVRDDTGFYLGLTYDHVVAGGISIALLLRRIVARYTTGADSVSKPPRLYPGTYGGPALRDPTMLRWWFSLPTTIANCRRSFRPKHSKPWNHGNRFTSFRIDAPEMNSLLEAAKRWSVTVNDLFLALLLRALAPIRPERGKASSRRTLAVASPIDTRRDFGEAPEETFGQFLGSFTVWHRVPAGASLAEIVTDIHSQTARIKSERRYLQLFAAKGLSNVLWRFLSSDRRHGFYQKYYPLAGIVTALNMNALWGRGGTGPRPDDYLRATSTGPVAPLVFALTTAGDALNVGVSFRTDTLSPEMVERIIAEFTREVAAL